MSTSADSGGFLSTDYVYTENGVAVSAGASFSFLGWEGPTTWTITFPVAIRDVLTIDFTAMTGVTIVNYTQKFDGALRLRAYDEADNIVGSIESAVVNRNSSVPISALGVLSLERETVKKVQLLGPSNSGPNLGLVGIEEGVTTYSISTYATLAVKMYRTAADLTWESVGEGSTYTLTQKLSGGLEAVVANQFFSLSFTTKNLRPGSSYHFRLYADLDLLNPVGSVHATTIGNDVSLDDVFETGDTIKLNIPGFRDKTGAKFVKRGGRVEYSPGVPVVFAFDPDEGPGQSATIELTDNTEAAVSFNEETDEVSVDGITCAVGDYVVVDGKKMTVVDI